MEFPRWMYHKDLPEGKIFKDSKELAAVGEGWVDSPALLGVSEVEVEANTPIRPKRGRPRKVENAGS